MHGHLDNLFCSHTNSYTASEQKVKRIENSASESTRDTVTKDIPADQQAYALSEQIGYLLRLSNQHHLEIFNRLIPDLTPTQFAMMVTLREQVDASQNELGRQIGIDAATTNGVVERLLKKNYLHSRADPNDKRRLRLSLSVEGKQKLEQTIPVAKEVSQQTLTSLTPRESQRLLQLLKKMHTSSC